MTVLDSIRGPADVRALPPGSLADLCGDLRAKIITTVRKNGGHLASSLGAVELIVALLRQYDPEEDRVIFDVGHQTYAWKLLTGRREQFDTLRTEGGLSGFPKRSESRFDHFDTGHSSTALSAALGYAAARDLLGQNHQVVAVVGDGAMINGMSLEALNHAGALQTRITCVLNDNGISISPRVGGLALHLAALSASPFYRRAKRTVKGLRGSLPLGRRIESGLERFRNRVKELLSRPNLFDDMGWTYWGPFDGHDIERMEEVFRLAHLYEKPLLIHLVTKKGKGDPDCESAPVKNHGVGPARPVGVPKRESWSSAVAAEVTRRAALDKRIVAITPAMGEGSCLGEFAARFPSRFFDVGIAEEHAMTLAAGMAAGGLRPFVFIYSTFLQRAADQLVHDVALQKLPVVLAIDRAGFVGEDGETHQGFFDLSWCSSIPGLQMWAPADRRSMEWVVGKSLAADAPFAFRFPRGAVEDDLLGDSRRTEDGLSVLSKGSQWAVLAVGSDVSLALEARGLAIQKGVPAPDVACLERISPLPEKALTDFCSAYQRVVTIESGYVRGGVGQQVACCVARAGSSPQFVQLGVPEVFVRHAPQARQRESVGLCPERILDSHV